MHKSLSSLLLLIVTFTSNNGYPSTHLRRKLLELRNVQDNRYFARAVPIRNVLSNAFLPSAINRSYNLDELLTACYVESGDARKLCVASLVRKMFPENFKGGKEGTKQQTTTKLTSGTTTSTLPYASTNSESTGVPCQPIVKSKGKMEITHDVVMSITSAVLIVPGETKKVSHITQDGQTSIQDGVVNSIGSIDPITCRREEFGFSDDVDPPIVDIANNMLCALCKHQGDESCISRWCFNGGYTGA